jgi:branched-chain amino acid transport system substrate-binding protein
MIRPSYRVLAGFAALTLVLSVLTEFGTPTSSGASSYLHSESNAPIKIGFIGSTSSAQGSSGSVVQPAYSAWVDKVNAGGGINGHRVQMIFKDDQENPSTAIAEVHELVEQDHVIAIVDGTDLDSGWASYVQQQHVPVIGGILANLTFISNPDFFPEGQTEDSLPISIALAVKKVGVKKFGILYCAESPDCSELTGPERTLAAKQGVSVSFAASISASAPNYVAQCLGAKQSEAEALFIADAVTTTLAAAASCVQQGYKPVMIADDGAVSKAFRTAPGFSDGMISMQPDIPFFVQSTPATKAMYAAFKKYKPNILKSSNFNEIATEAWASGLLFEAAAKAGKLGMHDAPTSQQLYDGLYSLHNETLGYIAPPLTFTKGAASNVVDCWYWMRTKDKKFTMPYGTKPVCAPKS